MNSFLKHAIFFSIFLYPVIGWSKTEVYFAGLSYIGDASNMGAAAPYASSIINNKAALSQYNSLLRFAVAEIDIDGVNISSGLGNSSQAMR